MLNMEQRQYTDDKTGKSITRYTPVLHPDTCATGSLRFAFWEVWTDESLETHGNAYRKDVANAREVLRKYSEI